MSRDILEALERQQSGLRVNIGAEHREHAGYHALTYDTSTMSTHYGLVTAEEKGLRAGRFRYFWPIMQEFKVVLLSGVGLFVDALAWIDEFATCVWSFHQEWDVAVFSFSSVAHAVQFKLTFGEEHLYPV